MVKIIFLLDSPNLQTESAVKKTNTSSCALTWKQPSSKWLDSKHKSRHYLSICVFPLSLLFYVFEHGNTFKVQFFPSMWSHRCFNVFLQLFLQTNYHAKKKHTMRSAQIWTQLLPKWLDSKKFSSHSLSFVSIESQSINPMSDLHKLSILKSN